MSGPHDLKSPDALEWVRARPQQFFATNPPKPVHLLGWVVADVVVLGGGSCTIRHAEGWWVIGSERDWLQHESISPTELFARVVADPRHGQHSMRAEVLLGAFAKSVWIASAGERTRIAGSEPPPSVWTLATDLRRAIVFSMDQ